MRTPLLILLISPILAFSQAKDAQGLMAKGAKKYSLKSGTIDYEISGDASGSEKLVFDNYGWSSMRKQVIDFELYGIISRQSIHEINDGNFAYRLKADDSTMNKRVDLKWSSIASYKNPEQLSEAILFSLGGSYNSDSTLNDRKCQVWTFENKSLQEMWIWNGLVLKKRTKLGDRIVISTAQSVDIDITIDASQFNIPAYYTVIE